MKKKANQTPNEIPSGPKSKCYIIMPALSSASSAANVTPIATPASPPTEEDDGEEKETIDVNGDDDDDHDTVTTTTSSTATNKKQKKKQDTADEGTPVTNEKNATDTLTSQLRKGKKGNNKSEDKYKIGTMLAIDLYGDGNHFEAELKAYSRSANLKDLNCCWVKLKYTNGNTIRSNDLNLAKVIDLSQHDILEYVDDATTDALPTEERGYLGRRIIVQWSDGTCVFFLLVSSSMSIFFISCNNNVEL